MGVDVSFSNREANIGAHGTEVTPVPIPTTEVKLRRGENIARVRR